MSVVRPRKSVSIAERLRKRNKEYWSTIEKPAPNPAQVRLREARKRHIQRLRRYIPFLVPLLNPSRQIRETIRVNGKQQPITILGAGYSMGRYARPIVIVLDAAGRAHLFYRSTGINSGMQGKWIPFNGIRMIKNKHGSAEAWYEKYNGHPRFPE